MAAAISVDFISNQQGIIAGAALTQVRFWDKSTTNNGVIVSWLWNFGDNHFWISSAGSPNLAITNANLYFAVNDTIFWDTGWSPAPFSDNTIYYVVAVTSTYIQLSATLGGGAINFTGANSSQHLYHGSDQQNPIAPYRTIAAGAYNVTLTCNDSGATGATVLTKTGYINAVTYTFSKPVNGGLFGRITIFVYDSTNATAINRLKSTNNNLFFQSLKCTSSITKAGTATFTVYNAGGATATEIGLMCADKNVAIISGRDVIWSGKISRAVQSKMSLFDTASPFMSWEVECESDISKMRYQNVKAANQIAYNAPPGYIINKLVEPASAGDIDWRGAVTPSLISFEGANIQYTITSADMQSQFLTLADLTGYDWRTRNDWIKYAYGASGYNSVAKTVTVAAIAPYTTNSFAGMWMLFINASNTIGIQAYGNIASNTTTVITLTSITNSGVPPASSDNVIILGKPVLDFSSDFRQPTYVSTFTMNKARASTLQNGYEMNDMSDFKQVITKAIAKGKDSNTNKTFAFSLAAPTVWDSTKIQFTDTTFITFKTMGYPVSQDGTYLYLDGWGWALPITGDTYIEVAFPSTGGVSGSAIKLSATSEIIYNGRQVTKCTFTAPWTTDLPAGTIAYLAGYFPNFAGGAYGLCLFVKSYSDIGYSVSGTHPDVKVGESVYSSAAAGPYCGTDATYGDYIVLTPLYDETAFSHFPGCLVWINSSYDESSPATGSPLDYFGLISKTLTADQQTSSANIEVYATNYLINHSFYYRKGTFWAFVYDWFKADIRPVNEVSENGWLRAGDEICILQHTGDSATDLEYGQYKNQWQVVAWTLDADQMTVTADLGDHERNTNTLINDKTSGINYTIT